METEMTCKRGRASEGIVNPYIICWEGPDPIPCADRMEGQFCQAKEGQPPPYSESQLS